MGIRAKKRKVIHREENGGCGHKWSTVEIPEEFMGNSIGQITENNNVEREWLG